MKFNGRGAWAKGKVSVFYEIVQKQLKFVIENLFNIFSRSIVFTLHDASEVLLFPV